MKPQGIKKFLRFVEIETKPATVLPALLALSYVFYTIGTINFISMVVYFVAAIFLDMSVTAVNNHFDRREDKNQEPHYGNVASVCIILAMLSVFALLGAYLAFVHGLTILVAGALCLFAGIGYTYGPAPISKSPYGEAVSGFIAGTVIMFIVVSINDPSFDPLGLGLNLADWRLAMDIDIVLLATFVLITLPPAFCTANITLANNICDAERDRPYRYTLVHHLGIKWSLYLFVLLYTASFVAVIASVLIGTIPMWCLLVFCAVPFVQKNIRIFFKKQEKSVTFVLAVKNFMVITFAYALGFVLGAIM